MSVDVILPCLDEAQALPGVLSRMPEGYRAIVVDNGSTDGSAEVAAAHGATVVHESRRGFGAAVHAGVMAASADIICVMDADGSFDPTQLPSLVAPVASDEVMLMLGNRRPSSWRSWPLHARFANLVLARLIRRYTRVKVHDLGPMRAIKRQLLLELDLRDRRSGYPLEMLLAVAKMHGRVGELPVTYAPRLGKSKVTGTLRGTWVAVKDMRAKLREYGRLS